MAQARADSGTKVSMSCARPASRRKGSSPRRSRAGIGLPFVRRERSSSWETRGMRGLILRGFGAGGKHGKEKKLLPQRSQRNAAEREELVRWFSLKWRGGVFR